MIKKIRNNLVLELHIPDFKRAKNFYKLFGFSQVLYDHHSGGGSDLDYMVLKREDKLGESLINFYGNKKKASEHAWFKNFPKNTLRGYGVEITVPVENIDKLWEKVKNKLGSKQISQRLETKRWGKKDFRIIDPFGFYIRFTEIINWGQ